MLLPLFFYMETNTLQIERHDMAFEIAFQPSGRTIRVGSDATILAAGQAAGIHIENACGSRGTCGKCRIRIVAGTASPVTEEERKALGETALATGWRLACRVSARSDMVIETPTFLDPVILERTADRTVKSNPAVRIHEARMTPASLADSRDDLHRLADAIDMDEAQIDPAVLRTLSPSLREASWHVAALVQTTRRGDRIVDVVPPDNARTYGIAVDLGTTTIAVYLYDLSSGNLCMSSSTMNPQIRYGDDVLTRLSTCSESQERASDLQRTVIQGINGLVRTMADDAGIECRQIVDAVIACNTVMHHLALHLDAKALGRAPFVPTTTEALDISAALLGLCILPAANVHFLPLIGGFVGGDTTAALLSETPFDSGKATMLIDIGTNSEICLAVDGTLAVTSCATGPALEGANIEHGMRASAGAIERVSIDPCTLEPTLGVIGSDETPVGICGSGIIDAVSQMAKVGIIEPSGSFSKRIEHSRIRRNERGTREYVLYEDTGRTITVTQKDVRAIQLAKAALYAGATALLDHCGISDVDEIILAGAFGNHLDRVNALELGLFPDCPLDDIHSVGNAAGLGACMALLDVDERARAKTVIRNATVIETALERDFQQRFSDAMAIPHAHDTFTKNRQTVWHCDPHEAHLQGTPSLPHAPFAQARAWASERALFPDGRRVPRYPFPSLDEIPAGHHLVDAPAIGEAFEALRSGAGENSVLEVSGPMALLSTLVDPSNLYRVRPAGKLDDMLMSFADEIADYVIAAIECGARVISLGDTEGCVEIVGKRFFRQHTGPALHACLEKIEPHLDHALIHVCGKSSVSLTCSGYARATPTRIESCSNYLGVLFACSADKKMRLIGNNCIHTPSLEVPILYRLELA